MTALERQTAAKAQTLFRERFASEYVIDYNAGAAYLRAGGTAKSARQQGYKLLTYGDVQAAVDKGQALALMKAEKKADLKATDVLEEMRRLMSIDMRDFFDELGNLKPINQWTKEQGAAVSSIEVVKRNLKPDDGEIDYVHKIRLWDKPKVMEMARDFFGLKHTPEDDERREVPVYIVATRVHTK